MHPDDDRFPERLYQEHDIELLLYARALLSEEELALIRGIVLEGATYAEMARRHGIGLWACCKRVQRGLDKLARGIRDEE